MIDTVILVLQEFSVTSIFFLFIFKCFFLNTVFNKGMKKQHLILKYDNFPSTQTSNNYPLFSLIVYCTLPLLYLQCKWIHHQHSSLYRHIFSRMVQIECNQLWHYNHHYPNMKETKREKKLMITCTLKERRRFKW